MRNLPKVTGLADHRVKYNLGFLILHVVYLSLYQAQVFRLYFNRASVVNTYIDPSDLFLGSNNLDKDHLDDPFSEVVSECA